MIRKEYNESEHLIEDLISTIKTSGMSRFTAILQTNDGNVRYYSGGDVSELEILGMYNMAIRDKQDELLGINHIDDDMLDDIERLEGEDG